jgi:Restriction endonuclease S subunits
MVRYLRAANVKDGQLDLRDVKTMNFTPNEQQLFKLLPGDVLVTEGSGSLSTVGASAVWRGELDGTVCFQNTLLRLRPRPNIADSRFLGWWAQSAFGSGLFASLANGANIYHLSSERLRTVRIDLPPLDEQRRIADFLDKETDRIEQLATRRKRQLSILDEYILAHMSETLIPGILSNARGSQPWPWLPELPERLPLVRLSHLCKLQNGFTLDSNRQAGEDAVTRPYLRVANVQAGALALDEVLEVTIPRSIAARCTLKRGDVLMTEGGDLDKLGRGTVWRGEIPDCLHQNHVFALRPDKDKLHSDYLALMTQTLHGRCYFESTGVKTTNLASTNSSKILSFPIPLPDLETQIGLSTQLLADLQAIANTKDAIRRQLDLLAERKQTLITAAVTGQIDVTTARGADLS